MPCQACNLILLGCVIVCTTVAPPWQSFRSSPIARELVRSLEDASMDTFAASDPQERGRFVAALYIRDLHLLVVSAVQPSSEAISRSIQRRAYRDAYLDLQLTPTREGRFFVQDAGADGLHHSGPGSGVDVVYEDGVRTTLLNGDLAGQQLTAAEYDARFDAADVRYAHALTVLQAAFKQHH